MPSPFILLLAVHLSIRGLPSPTVHDKDSRQMPKVLDHVG